MTPSRLAFVLLLVAAPLEAQSEAELRQYFEGQRVTLKLALPGTEEGVDVYPGTPRPLDYPRYAERLKKNGTAIGVGDGAMITKIRVKSKHIEFQLDGGGYGTMSDETSTSVPVRSAEKSKREKNLEAELNREKDPVKRRALKEELDDLQNDREREDSRNRAEVADAEEQKKENLRQRRLDGGSRFNVRFRDQVPGGVLTPAGLQSALAEYVTFPPRPVNVSAGGGAITSVSAVSPVSPSSSEALGAAPQQARGGIPRKGMSAAETEAQLGAPLQTTERDEGKLRVVTRTYRTDAGVDQRGLRGGRADSLLGHLRLTAASG